MTEILPNVYAQALAKAKTELAALEADFEKMSLHKAQLEAFIANVEPLVPATTQPIHSATPKFLQPRSSLPVPIWKSIVLSINGKSESFSVNDALAGLARIGRPVESPNRVQIVRNVLMKKTENFEQIAAGRFRLKKPEREGAALEGTMAT